LEERVRAAAFVGTLQASYTDFHYLRPIWQRTTEKDALLGVGMTGIGSGKVEKLDLKAAAKASREENERVAELIGINKSARTTTIKPSGTSSCVLGTSSGIHAWHNDYYLRRLRVGKNEAIYSYLAINHPNLIEDEYFRPHDTAVIGIPQKAPEGSILRSESPIQLLERVKHFNSQWIRPGHKSGMNTHNISATVSIRSHEWDAVGNWMWSNRESFNGLSVLPYDGGSYIQSPFEDITEEKYNQLVETLADVNLSNIVETEDNTDLTGELACAGGSCELK
jgi:ribonucleoside-diphosphate reductase alpha chain